MRRLRARPMGSFFFLNHPPPVAEIQDRMPVILAPSDYARWLGEEPDSD